jgi:hypothetical protein
VHVNVDYRTRSVASPRRDDGCEKQKLTGVIAVTARGLLLLFHAPASLPYFSADRVVTDVGRGR